MKKVFICLIVVFSEWVALQACCCKANERQESVSAKEFRLRALSKLKFESAAQLRARFLSKNQFRSHDEFDAYNKAAETNLPERLKSLLILSSEDFKKNSESQLHKDICLLRSLCDANKEVQEAERPWVLLVMHHLQSGLVKQSEELYKKKIEEMPSFAFCSDWIRTMESKKSPTRSSTQSESGLAYQVSIPGSVYSPR